VAPIDRDGWRHGGESAPASLPLCISAAHRTQSRAQFQAQSQTQSLVHSLPNKLSQAQTTKHSPTSNQCAQLHPRARSFFASARPRPQRASARRGAWPGGLVRELGGGETVCVGQRRARNKARLMSRVSRLIHIRGQFPSAAALEGAFRRLAFRRLAAARPARTHCPVGQFAPHAFSSRAALRAARIAGDSEPAEWANQCRSPPAHLSSAAH